MKVAIAHALITIVIGILFLVLEAGPYFMFGLVVIAALGHVYRTHVDQRAATA